VKTLVTGAAGFIGFHTARALLAREAQVLGLDNLDPYYDVALKRARLARLQSQPRFRFLPLDIADDSALAQLFAHERFDNVVHLAAQAGVRHSLAEPHAYVRSNITGTLNVLEGCRHHGVQHLVFASTSSVYGANTRLPFSVHRPADHPLSLYAASKRACELMAHNYAALFAIPATGLRLFTVYGPWGRPDMALFRFTRNILEGEPIDVFNYGQHRRDFTYVDDVVEALLRVLDHPARPDDTWSGDDPDPASSRAPFRLYNVGNHAPVPLMRYIEIIEECLGRKARKNLLPMQAGDVPDTCADIEDLRAAVGYRPVTPVEVGVRRFVEWFCEFYGYVQNTPRAP